MVKSCTKCNRLLDETEFNWKIKDIKRSFHCKECSREYVRNHYKNNLQYYLDKTRKRNKRIMVLCHEYINSYLSSHKCIDCGENDVLVLEFDHRIRSEKSFDISRMNRQGYSLERLVEEISKCDIRCANCHRRKTAKESGSWKLKYAPVA